MTFSLGTNIVVSDIVELSLEVHTGDPVRDIYSVMTDIDTDICKIMNSLRQQERELCRQ